MVFLGDPHSTLYKAADHLRAMENKERFVLISIQRKPCPLRPIIPNSTDHGESGEIIEAIAVINKYESFSLLSRIWSCHLSRTYNIMH